MLKETITYPDFNGLERTEDFYFNLTKTELLRLEKGRDVSFSGELSRIINAKDAPDIFMAIENLIHMAYGEKSDDGRYFNKSKEISDRFVNSAAYDVLFEKLTTDSDYAYKFVTGMIPSDLATKIEENGGVANLNLITE